MEKLKIGLIDFGIRTAKLNSLLKVNDLINYAYQADELGYSRFWLGEHHIPDPTHTWNDPTILIPILASMTSKIRIGTAGILLSIHQPYHVACNFKMLTNLFPNRIDLGLANGGVMSSVAQLATGIEGLNMPEAFKNNLDKFFYIINNESEVLQIGTVVSPYKGVNPDVWSLSTGMGKSIDRALEHGTNLSRSIFHTNADMEAHKDKLAEFKEAFYNKHNRYPKVNLVVSGICHKTTAKAKRAVGPLRDGFGYNITGTPAQFHEAFLAFSEKYGVDEIIFMNAAKEPKDRLMGIELIAQEFSLPDSAKVRRVKQTAA
ncbi:LLM class flavin-dependent oxidoreductase [Mucilaginibacter sp. KACC 22063]|uniref:LLM class flavin-dependent oxidoreductase n=1 Tax=Mucilaginibacter sp. KACC 22063 TaxID=3025666 RepID=UPI002366E1B9|nr:LLM class flavin-dependent oxidoreductase [Mucilaginibacter sp. KACC 22063]WDF56032.1 LLM class flavin-dependent oxidoreductase [Mucilaginibacter sp. KACC 22063]